MLYSSENRVDKYNNEKKMKWKLKYIYLNDYVVKCRKFKRPIRAIISRAKSYIVYNYLFQPCIRWEEYNPYSGSSFGWIPFARLGSSQSCRKVYPLYQFSTRPNLENRRGKAVENVMKIVPPNSNRPLTTTYNPTSLLLSVKMTLQSFCSLLLF